MHKNKIKIHMILEPIYHKNGFLYHVEKFFRYIELKLFVIPKINKISSKKTSLKIFSHDKSIVDYLTNQGLNNVFYVNNINTNYVELSKNVKKTVNKIFQESSLKIIQLDGLDIKTVLEYDLLTYMYNIYVKISDYESIFVETIDFLYIENLQSYDGKIVNYLSKKNNMEIKNLHPQFYRKLRNFIFKRMSYNDYKYLANINIYADKFNSKNKKTSILVDAIYINYLRNINPVLKELFKKNECNFYYIAKKEDLKYFKIKSNILKKFKAKMEVNKEINYIINALFSDENLLKVFEKDLNALNLFKVELSSFYEKSIPYFLMKLRLSKNFLSEIHTDLVLVGDDRSTVTRVGILPFIDKNIPIIEIQHGIFANTNIFINLMTKPISDKICVWGKSSKNFLIDLGVPENEIEITGSPNFDKYQKIKPIKTNESKINILFATGPQHLNINFEVIEEIAAKIKEVSIHVKPHPTENHNVYKFLGEKFPKTVSIQKNNAELFSLLQNSDIVLVTSSTVGLEAILLDKMLICINLWGYNLDYVNKGLALEVKHINELVSTIEKSFNTEVSHKLAKNRSKFSKDYTYKNDGNSTERVIKVIQDLV